MRLFIAILFPENIKSNLYQVIQDLKTHSTQGNFTLKENLHLTLAFIGESEDINTIQKAMKQALTQREVKSFPMQIEGFGKFKRQEGDIYWLGINKNPELSDLNRAIVKELNENGFHIEDREFKPHLTLGRKVKVKESTNLKEMEKNIQPMEMNVARISLMKSERIAGKLVYTEIFYCEL